MTFRTMCHVTPCISYSFWICLHMVSVTIKLFMFCLILYSNLWFQVSKKQFHGFLSRCKILLSSNLWSSLIITALRFSLTFMLLNLFWSWFWIDAKRWGAFGISRFSPTGIDGVSLQLVWHAEGSAHAAHNLEAFVESVA